MESALATNPKILEQEATIRAREESLYGKKAQYYPSVSVTANTYDQILGKTLVVLRQPVWSFGKIEDSIQLAEIDLNTEANSIKKIQRDVIDEVVSLYIKACGSKQKVLVTNANTEEHTLILEKIKRRAIGGLATESDVRTAYSRVMQSKNQSVVQQAEYDVALSELSELAHTPVDEIEILDLATMNLEGLEALQDKIISTNPEIERAHDEIESLRQKTNYVKALSTPDVYFQVQETVNPGPGQKGLQAGLKMDYQFNGLGQVNQAQVGETVSQMESAEERLSTQIMELTRKVRSIWINRTSSEKQIHNQRLIITNVESSMVSQLRLYDAGKKSLIELLNTQRELSDARITLIQSQTDWILNTAKLKVMAGGFDELSGIARE
ncbi:MAG: hypothetical protein RLZZ627_1568 [Pseudomonadota bacterium]|jgi:adhesin transport system outer membrane protein